MPIHVYIYILRFISDTIYINILFVPWMSCMIVWQSIFEKKTVSKKCWVVYLETFGPYVNLNIFIIYEWYANAFSAINNYLSPTSVNPINLKSNVYLHLDTFSSSVSNWRTLWISSYFPSRFFRDVRRYARVGGRFQHPDSDPFRRREIRRLRYHLWVLPASPGAAGHLLHLDLERVSQG